MHKSQDELLKELALANKSVKVGGIYNHYKDVSKEYRVLNLAITENDDKICVIYQALYGKKLIFVRPLLSWLSSVKWHGQEIKRFTLIN